MRNFKTYASGYYFEKSGQQKVEADHCFGGLSFVVCVDATTPTKLPGWKLLSCDQSSACAIGVV